MQLGSVYLNTEIDREGFLELLGALDCARDAVLAALLGLNPNELTYLEHASGIFGEWDEEVVTQARESGIKIF